MDAELPVVHGGTFSGSLMGVAAALACLDLMGKSNFYPTLFRTANLFFSELRELFRKEGVTAQVQHVGSSFTIYFGVSEPVTDYRQFAGIDRDMTQQFFRKCIEKGIYFHTDFTVSAAHETDDIYATLDTMKTVIRELKK